MLVARSSMYVHIYTQTKRILLKLIVLLTFTGIRRSEFPSDVRPRPKKFSQPKEVVTRRVIGLSTGLSDRRKWTEETPSRCQRNNCTVSDFSSSETDIGIRSVGFVPPSLGRGRGPWTSTL